MLKGFVVVVIVFSVIGSIILFFCWDNHVGFGVIACWGCLVLVAFFFGLWVSRVASCFCVLLVTIWELWVILVPHLLCLFLIMYQLNVLQVLC